MAATLATRMIGPTYIYAVATYSRKERRKKKRLSFSPICGIPGSHGNGDPADATACTRGSINGPSATGPASTSATRERRKAAAATDARGRRRRRKAFLFAPSVGGCAYGERVEDEEEERPGNELLFRTGRREHTLLNPKALIPVVHARLRVG
ncbi:hypothetical protein MRX96_004476 [Rhipicephalus microplus]